MAYDAAAHRRGDDVAVAVRDLEAGDVVDVRFLEGGPSQRFTARDPIPLGHKIALQDLPAGKAIIEYGERIGRAIAPIPAGAHVHVHNLKSLRWSA